MGGYRRWLAMPGLILAALSAGTAAQVGPPRPGPRCLPGIYDGSQPEIAAQLDLAADHRFRYAMSYGALDEVAEGKWALDPSGETVRLTSDAITPPVFRLLGEAAGTAARLNLTLDVPSGISRQYFSAIVRFASGRSVVREFREEGLTLDLGADERLVSVSLLLPVLSLESDAFPVSSGGGADLYVRFEPNDLGRVAFTDTPLKVDREELLLERHDRLIRFRPDRESC